MIEADIDRVLGLIHAASSLYILIDHFYIAQILNVIDVREVV
jgi:hypothetical protein